MEEIVIQINGEIIINADVSVKNVIYVKNIMFGIQVQVIMKMENIQQVLWMIQRDEIIEETVPTNLNEK